MAGEPTWFELGVAEPAKARAFYGELFGWQFEVGPAGEDAGAVIRTPGIDGGLHGGDEGARFALCRDDQGSGFGLHEPPAS
jgi:uncharacterized protein